MNNCVPILVHPNILRKIHKGFAWPLTKRSKCICRFHHVLLLLVRNVEVSKDKLNVS